MSLKHKSAPIGVFDSGMGGLTVLRHLIDLMPDENFLYVADTKNLPYGDKSSVEIIGFVDNILQWFSAQKVKMVVMACHTSSAIAHQILSKQYEFPVLCSITPIATHLRGSLKKIGIMATKRTIESQVFEKYLLHHNPNHQIVSRACPEFVPLIEERTYNTEFGSTIIKSYLDHFLRNEVETLIFGCTHYPFLKEKMIELFPNPDIIFFEDPGFYLAQEAQKQLKDMELENDRGEERKIHFFASSSPQSFEKKIEFVFGQHFEVGKI